MSLSVAQAEIINKAAPFIKKGNLSVQSLSDWAVNTPVILDGQPFTFKKHEYLKIPYEDNHPHQVELKAAQMGLTTKAMLRAFYAAKYRNYKGILYLFPSRTDVLDFSKGRITPLIQDNPDTLGSWIKDTDSASIKQVAGCVLYLRGMVSRVGLKSVPADLIIFDELDEAPQNRVDMAMERMGHSEYRESLKLSNPTIPEYGIDRAFRETDQRQWMIKCSGCGKYTSLIDTFLEAKPPEIPRCLKVTKTGDVLRVCVSCGHELDVSKGEWVPARPSITDKRGYHYSQLFSQYVTPKEVIDKYLTTDNLQDFYNLKIGVAYIESENRLSIEEVLSLCGDEGIQDYEKDLCSMGVDQGKDLHVVISKTRVSGIAKIVHMGVYLHWEDLDRLIKNYNVYSCVVDALPETRNARAFAERHKGKVYLNYYQIHQKGRYKWNEQDLTVSCNRTESLDASHNEILHKKVTLPKKCDIVREFALHLHNVAKKLEEDDETGSKRYVYVKLGPDHFRHAFNYESMARSIYQGKPFGELVC